MKSTTTASFGADWDRLTGQKRELLTRVVLEVFEPACERRARSPGTPWPRSLRVRDVAGAPGVWEMTWDWPDGRATFEWIELDGAPASRWRRIGTQRIFGSP